MNSACAEVLLCKTLVRRPAPQPISPEKERKLLWTRRLLGWARFLM